MNGENYVADGAIVKNTKLGLSTHALSGAKLRNTTIDHSVVFDNVTIEDSEIDHSLIDRDAKIKETKLDGALIGELTQVE